MSVLDFWLKNPLIVGGTFLVLMILDGILTKRNFILYKQKYANFFEGELFEANVLFQQVIHKDKPFQKWTYVSIGIFTIFAMAASWLLSESYSIWMVEFGLGAGFFILFDTFIDHIKSLFRFKFVKYHPESLKGKITLSKDFQFAILRQETFVDSFLLILIWIFIGRAFLLGGAFGLVLLSLTSLVWKSKTK